MLRSDLLATIQKMIKELFHNAIIPLRIGISKSRAFYGWQSQMIQLGLLSPQSRLNIPQAVLAAGLGIEKGSQLVPSGKFLNISVPGMLGNRIIKVMSGHKG